MGEIIAGFCQGQNLAGGAPRRNSSQQQQCEEGEYVSQQQELVAVAWMNGHLP